ncbi:GATA zinc finger domain-containing protein 4-like isoform X2 [Drosophila virilis]|uniref:GATA zinc finger domain-containing protein 4-like isoform X2 n=1 Tax=Drosophila virilis TaxID=7244 RepID=UPI0038B34F82
MQAHLWAISNWHINFGFPIRHLALAAAPQTAKQRKPTRKSNAIGSATNVRPKRKSRTLSIISATRSNVRRVCWTLKYDGSKNVRNRTSSDNSSSNYSNSISSTSSNNSSNNNNSNSSSSNSSSNSSNSSSSSHNSSNNKAKRVHLQHRRIHSSSSSSNNNSSRSSNNSRNNSSNNSRSDSNCSCNKVLQHRSAPVDGFTRRTHPSCKHHRIARCRPPFAAAPLSGKFNTNANASRYRNQPNSRRP